MQGRNPARFKGGYGVPRGFKGEKSKSPPNPLGLAERVPSSADDDSSFSKQQQHNQQLQTHLTVAIPEFLKKTPSFRKIYFICFICFMCFICPVCVSEEKDIQCKSNGFKLLPPPAGGPPPSRREVWGFRRSRPTALPSIGYRGFAVAPITLRAPARRVVRTSGINGRAMRAPYRARRCNQRLQMHLTVAMMQPSVANASHSCNFPPRCRGAHRAPADILPTFDFPAPKTSLFEGGGPPAGGGRSIPPFSHIFATIPQFCVRIRAEY